MTKGLPVERRPGIPRGEAIGWEEWQTEAGLERLAEMMPHRYVRDEVGRWRCPPGESFAEPFGLFYRLRSSAEIDWVFQRNLRLLEDYLGVEGPAISEQIAKAILALVEQQPGLQLDDLLVQMGETRIDDTYTLIAANRLYVDLRAAPLAEPERVRLFRGRRDSSRLHTRRIGAAHRRRRSYRSV